MLEIMLKKLMVQWKTFVFPRLISIVAEAVHRLQGGATTRNILTDAEYLSAMARYREISEYELFKVAAREWHLPRLRIDHDFKRYLLDDIMPYYVKDFVRKARARRYQAVAVPR